MNMILQTLIAMSAVVALLIACWPLARRHVAPGTRYLLCVLVLLGLLVPVRFRVALPQPAAFSTVVQTMAAPQASMEQALTQTAIKMYRGESAPKISQWQLLLIYWGCGALAVLGVGILRHLRLVRHVRRCALALGEVQGMPVFSLNSHLSPFVIGWRRPKLVLPEGYVLSERVLRHEQAHVRRGDALFRVLCLLVRALHWWNPLALWFVKIAGEDCELSCDALALRGADEGERLDYAHRVLEAASGGVPASALSSAWGGGKRQMKQRLSAIVQPVGARKGYALIALVSTLVLCAGSVLAEPAATFSGDVKRQVYGDGLEFRSIASVEYREWLVRTDDHKSWVERSWALNPEAKLKQGWTVELATASRYIEGAEMRIAVAVAVPPGETPDLDAQLARALDQADTKDEEGSWIGDALMAAFPDVMLQAECVSPDMASSSVGLTDELVALFDVDKRAWLIQRAMERGATELVRDPRELTAAPSTELRDQILLDYAGRNVLIEFANGSLWEMHDDIRIASYRLRQQGVSGEAQLDIMPRLVALTKQPPSQLCERAYQIANRMYREDMVPKDELQAKLFPALCAEFGIDESEAGTCFELSFSE